MSNPRPLINKQELVITLVCLLPLCLFAIGGYLIYQAKDIFTEAFTLDTEEKSDVLSIEERCNLDSLLAKYENAHVLTETSVNSSSQDTHANEVMVNPPKQERAYRALDIAFDQYYIANIGKLERIQTKPANEQFAYRDQIRMWLYEGSANDQTMVLLDELKLKPREIKIGVLAAAYFNDGIKYTSSQFNQTCEVLVLREAVDKTTLGALKNKGSQLDKVSDK